jgi:hypothetical protein
LKGSRHHCWPDSWLGDGNINRGSSHGALAGDCESASSALFLAVAKWQQKSKVGKGTPEYDEASNQDCNK